MHGIPSHDTFGEVFAAIDPDAFEACFRTWTQAVAGAIVGIAAIDGTTLRRSYDRATGNAAVHMVSAWAADNGVVFGQVAVKDKSNEITAIPAFLKMLQIKGLIITIDAMGCQKEIAVQIAQQGGEYMLRVKDNQPTLRRAIEAMFQWADGRDYAELAHAHSDEGNKGHGRFPRGCQIEAGILDRIEPAFRDELGTRWFRLDATCPIAIWFQRSLSGSGVEKSMILDRTSEPRVQPPIGGADHPLGSRRCH